MVFAREAQVFFFAMVHYVIEMSHKQVYKVQALFAFEDGHVSAQGKAIVICGLF